ncbi:hypothetical protein [Mesorhizobium opportunistum]|uniref:Secreted protein n=1 Tax=Mesorhizobium opportunistum (strain LMG 24607 / HAMBI 3007 / WSM2075) TaxID=536019 RepID=F7YFZ4_MESOW|nr:hypothetical protein [Mesorhizobium opportunistum]AEH88025.1 conserved hypothetical protein [Mesorhizobium opportunistum WSM2075]
MTMPILATAFMIAAAIPAMRATIVAASRESMVKKSTVKVRSQRYPANTKNPRLR